MLVKQNSINICVQHCIRQVILYIKLFTHSYNINQQKLVKCELTSLFELALERVQKQVNSVAELVEVHAIPRQIYTRLRLAYLRPIVHWRQVRLVKTAFE